MGFARKLILLALVLVGLSYSLYEPIPDGYSTSSTLNLRVRLAMQKFFFFIGDLIELAGGDSSLYTVKAVSKFLAGLKQKTLPENVRESVFDSVPVRIYEPANRKGASLLPGFVYYHGGGWVLGDFDTHHSLANSLGNLTNTVLVSVGYRLAPEWVFPAAHDDCVAATKYFIQHASQFGVDPQRIAIGGDSAGGNMAATVALKLRDEDFKPSVKLQVLIYPVTQSLDFDLPSMTHNAQGPFLTRKIMPAFASAYINAGGGIQNAIFARNGHMPPKVRQQLSKTFINVDNLPKKYLKDFKRSTEAEPVNETLWESIKEKMLSPYLSPLIAPKMDRLPMTYVYTCEHDVLRDEGFLYVHRLKEAGNKVTHVHLEKGFHGLLSMGIPESLEEIEKLADFIVRNV